MRRTLSVSLALVMLSFAINACSPLASSNAAKVILPKPNDSMAVTRLPQIVGIWQIFNAQCTPGYMIIRNNGTFAWSCSRDGSNGISGKYHFARGHFVVLSDLCGQEGAYAGHMVSGDPHILRFTAIEDPCQAEVSTFTTQNVTWDSPLP